MLNLIQPDVIIEWLSRVGVLLLLFEAGLETNLRELKKQGRVAIFATIGGVTLPFLGGFGVSYMFYHSVHHALFTGTMLVATSVGVTVMTLMDMKKLKSSEGITILGAAILDDIIAIIILTFVIGFVQKDSNIYISILKIFGYFLTTFIVGSFLIKPVVHFSRKMNVEFALVSIALGVAFLFAWLAELVGVAEITGAYLAGLFFGQSRGKRTITDGIDSLGQIFFVAIFFVNIGLKTELHFSNAHIIFGLLFVLTAIITKIFGAGIGAKIGGYNWRSSFIIGVGMVPRGEVILVVAALALELNVIEKIEFSNVVVLVITSAILTPIALKKLFLTKQR